MLKEFSLEGKTALVTGGGSGIGRAIAVVFAEAGADVAVAARTLKNVEDTAEQVRGLGRRGVAIQCDVSDSEQVDAMVHQATQQLGRIEILVNNAGTGAADGRSHHYRSRRRRCSVPSTTTRRITGLGCPTRCGTR